MTTPWDLEMWVRVLTFVPILASSAIGFAVTLTKWAQLRRVAQTTRRLMPRVRTLIGEGDFGSARAVALAEGSPVAAVMTEALAEGGWGRERVTARTEHAGRDVVRFLNHGLGAVALIASLGPLFGLFGTVVGISIVFERLADTEGLVSQSQLAGGIGTALYTTIAGLIVGICALVSHRWLTARCDQVTAQLEAVGRELVELVSEDDR